ncbi:MAG: UDP-N-acetylmuramate dehydrogenase [Spirochaetales bacterium]|nr:MAG: UDP-N-acetylmuramate dehydrogenase [Spirochaetales bacterium]
MKMYTSFRIGGIADILAEPADTRDLAVLAEEARKAALPMTILGEGANILVSDKGIRGLVIRMAGLSGIHVRNSSLRAEAGAKMTDTVTSASAAGLSGLEFIYAMPGSVGGSVWMNARCFGHSISEVLSRVEYIGSEGPGEYHVRAGDFGYKKSPFQSMDAVITAAEFSLAEGRPDEIRAALEKAKREREEKGHFLHPSAGSVFKNNRGFGKPTGKLLESLGLKGVRKGGAQIAPFHANIIINTGGASASDVRELMELAEEKVLAAYGFVLEREILLVGEW